MGSRDSIAAHAQKLLKDAVDSGKILPDSGAAVADAVVPSFSSGTAALDPNTGRPVSEHVPKPSVLDTTSTAPLPEADLEAGAAAEAAAAGKSAGAPQASTDPAVTARERNASGQFVGDPNKPAAAKAPKETPLDAAAQPSADPPDQLLQ